MIEVSFCFDKPIDYNSEESLLDYDTYTKLRRELVEKYNFKPNFTYHNKKGNVVRVFRSRDLPKIENNQTRIGFFFR